MIRLHDDNLINIHFFESVLKILNSSENIAIATASFKIFFTEYGSSFLYPDITDKIKKYYSRQPLGHDIILINNKTDFIAQMIKRFNDRFLPPIGNTPFLVIRTDLFKEFQAEKEKEKYAKADDTVFYLFALKHGSFACLSDTNATFFRAHPNRDSETDENSLNLEQTENWTRMYTQTFRENADPEIWKGFFCLFYAVFPAFLKKDLVKTYPNKALLEHFFKCGVLPSFASSFYNEEEILNRMNKINSDQQKVYKSYLLPNGGFSETNDFWENVSGFRKYIGIKHFTKNGVKRKYLILFKHRILLWKVKKRQK